MGHGGGYVATKKKLLEAERQRVRDFQPISSRPGQDFEPFRGHFFRFSAENPPQTLKPGETKARNGFSTLKIGGYHVSSPWAPPLLTRRPPGRVPRHVRARGPRVVLPYASTRAHPPRDLPRRPSGGQKWVPRADNIVSPYFEGAESISGLGLPQFHPFRGVWG